MPSYGLLSNGFAPKTTEVVLAELVALFQSKFGASVDTSTVSVLGMLAGIVADREAALWDLMQQVYSSQDPDAASGAALDALCTLTGTFRQPARASTVTLTLTGTPTTVVASNSQAKTASTGALFKTLAGATIAALTTWTPTTAYVVGDRRTNASRAYQCITAGVSAGAGGPTTTASDITDGTVHWRYLGDGTGAVDAASASVNTGAIVAVSGDVNQIQTPVGGWSSVINLLDAVVGADVQSDQSLRASRVAQLSSAGAATRNAIRSAVLQVSGVTSCTVFVNDTDVTNSDGMTPHSVEVLVQGGQDAPIASALFAQVAAGIAFVGTTSVVVVDSQGVNQTVKFSRPAQINVFVDVTIVKDSSTYPSDGDAQVKAAIVAYGAKQLVGKDAVAASVGAQAFVVAGVLDVTISAIHTASIATATAWAPTTAYTTGNVVTNVGRKYICIANGTSAGSGGPTTTGTDITDGTAHWFYLGNTIAITTRQLAAFDTSRIAVVASSGTP